MDLTLNPINKGFGPVCHDEEGAETKGKALYLLVLELVRY